MNTQTLELDLSKHAGNQCVIVGQGDASGTTVKATIYDNGADAAITGHTAYFVALLPDKRHYYRGSATVSGNTVTHVVNEEKLAAVAGYTDEAYFTFEKGAVKYSTERFAVDIRRSALDGKKPAENWDNQINDIVRRGSEAVASANNAAASANRAAGTANDAAATALASSEAADESASNADDATNAAVLATARANKSAGDADAAAEKASTSAENADAATGSANKAATSANTAAGLSNTAAARANGAAENATAAASNALNIANSIASIEPPSDKEVEELHAANATLATAVAELQDAYVVLGKTVYVPSSRVASSGGGNLTLNNATFSGSSVVLK